ncbi:hypothetical protein [Vibrio sp. PNB22_4_2]
MNILISPYPALKDKLEKQGIIIDHVHHRFSPESYTRSDVIYGQLRVEDSRVLSEKRIPYLHITASIPSNLSPDEVTMKYLDGINIDISEHQFQDHGIPLRINMFNRYKVMKKVIRQNWQKWKTSAWLIWLLTTLSLASFAWLGDLLAGESLFPWLPENLKPSQTETIAITPTFILFAVYVFCSYSLIKLGRAFLPSLRRVNVTNNPKPKKILLLTVSKIEGLSIAHGVAIYQNRQNTTIELTGSIEQDITLLDGQRWNGTQLLRGLSKHLPKVKKIILLSTEDVGTSDDTRGTRHKLDSITEFLNLYINPEHCQISACHTYLDPNDVGETYYRLSEILDDLVTNQGLSEKDICLDITGGTSAMSAAAALATIHRDTKFQYISTIGENEIYQQDLQLAASPARYK